MTGQEAKQIRLDLGYTQLKMAQTLGYAHRQRIIEIEKGIREINPRIQKLFQLAKERKI